jgi:hypothetical protein
MGWELNDFSGDGDLTNKIVKGKANRKAISLRLYY